MNDTRGRLSRDGAMGAAPSIVPRSHDEPPRSSRCRIPHVPREAVGGDGSRSCPTPAKSPATCPCESPDSPNSAATRMISRTLSIAPPAISPPWTPRLPLHHIYMSPTRSHHFSERNRAPTSERVAHASVLSRQLVVPPSFAAPPLQPWNDRPKTKATTQELAQVTAR
jgi:hypothetical protein